MSNAKLLKQLRQPLIDEAVGVNENYRTSEEDRNLELGFLYGTAELIVALTISENESYNDIREEIAQQIDQRAAQLTYPILEVNGAKVASH